GRDPQSQHHEDDHADQGDEPEPPRGGGAGAGRPIRVGVGAAGGTACEQAGHDSSRSGPKAKMPAARYRTANTVRRPSHGQPSPLVLDRAASNARVDPMRTGASTGNRRSGSNVSRTRRPEASTP